MRFHRPATCHDLTLATFAVAFAPLAIAILIALLFAEAPREAGEAAGAQHAEARP